MNKQTPGPVIVGKRSVKWGGQPIKAAQDYIATTNPGLLAAEANAALLAASYSSFDKAGRELGVDATKLARFVDIAELIRAALHVHNLENNPDYGSRGSVVWDKEYLARNRALGAALVSSKILQ